MLEAPWALLALLSLPILVWIHRRRRQGVPVDVPSLLFLEPEDAQAIAPDRRRFDAELALTLAAATCLALAAAGPRVAVGAPAPRVRVVLDASPAMDAKATPTSKSPREQGEAALAALGLSDSIVRARGKPTDLVAAARREPADVRIVVSDRAITPVPPDVHVAAFGDPAAQNGGIVAVHVDASVDGRPNAMYTVWNHSRTARRMRMNVEGEVREFLVPADGASAVLFQLPAGRSPVIASLDADHGPSMGWVKLRADPVTVALDPRLPAAHRRAVEDVFTAIAGEGGVVFGPSGELAVDLGPSPVVRRPDGVLVVEDTNALYVELSILKGGEATAVIAAQPSDELDPVLRGVDATGSECLGPRRTGAMALQPLVKRVGGRGGIGITTDWSFGYAWMADPLAGSPSPVDSPAWPVFWANLVEFLRGSNVGAGWRAEKIDSLDEIRLGRDRIPIDPAWIAEAKPVAPAPKDLRLPLIVGGALCLLLLWFAPRGRRVATVG